MFRAAFLVFLAVLALGSVPASAQGRRAPPPGVTPLDRVLPQVRSRYPGTFYDADGPFMDERGNPHYRLKWMTPEGRVIWLDTDARTGRVIGVERRGNREPYATPPRDAPPPEVFGRGPRGYPGGEFRGRGPERGDRGWNGGHRGWGGGPHGRRGGGHGHRGG